MTMFQFNFSQSSGDDNDTEQNTSKNSEEPVVKAQELDPGLIITDIQEEISKNSPETLQYLQMKYMSSPLKLSNSEEMFKDISHTDLSPNIYEGGYKIWECTFDLLNFCSKNNIDFKNKVVLDLGCGAGLLGLYALQNGAVEVYFQDFNKEVLECLTLPNVVLNKFNTKCKFYYGDWGGLTDLIKVKFDIILTSETIYNVNNYSKLINVFDGLLNKTGVVYLAAKVYYFGVGGCIYDFEKITKERNFSVENCFELEEGVKRKIIKISFNEVKF